MLFTKIDITSITEQFSDLAQQIIDSWEDLQMESKRQKTPDLLLDAMQRLGRTLSSHEQNQEADNTNEINALGDYGIQLIVEMSDCCAELGLHEQARTFENLTLPFAIWIARHGAELRHPEPIINALAYHANHLAEPEDMASVFAIANEIMEAISPNISQDENNHHPERPWRLLLLNRGIIATRTLNPSFMEHAFNAIAEYLPDDAPSFFEQGMEQLDIIGYPEQVRKVMQDYYLKFCSNRTIH